MAKLKTTGITKRKAFKRVKSISLLPFGNDAGSKTLSGMVLAA
jgi:hypothetical protein